MKLAVTSLSALALGAALTLAPREAHALGPLDLEAGLKVGVGTTPSNLNAQINPLGLGIGGRAGVSIFGLYGGLNIVDYLGSSQSNVSVHALQYGAEVGYGWKLMLLQIRPQVGFGSIGFKSSIDSSVPVIGGTSQTNSYFYLEPGVTALISLGLLYVGADANVLFMPSVTTADGSSTSSTAITLHAQVGVTL
jgi:hypothetical protein